MVHRILSLAVSLFCLELESTSRCKHVKANGAASLAQSLALQVEHPRTVPTQRLARGACCCATVYWLVRVCGLAGGMKEKLGLLGFVVGLKFSFGEVLGS